MTPPAGPALWVGALVVEEDRILLVRRSSPPEAGLWSLPAAQVAPDEPLAAAVVRAVLAGTGLEAVCDGLLGYLESFAPSHRVLLAFAATALPGPAGRGDPWWVGLEEVTDRPLAEGLPEFLAEQGILPLIA